MVSVSYDRVANICAESHVSQYQVSAIPTPPVGQAHKFEVVTTMLPMQVKQPVVSHSSQGSTQSNIKGLAYFYTPHPPQTRRT